mgnify:CR=1 FL=1
MPMPKPNAAMGTIKCSGMVANGICSSHNTCLFIRSKKVYVEANVVVDLGGVDDGGDVDVPLRIHSLKEVVTP